MVSTVSHIKILRTIKLGRSRIKLFRNDLACLPAKCEVESNLRPFDRQATEPTIKKATFPRYETIFFDQHRIIFNNLFLTILDVNKIQIVIV